MLTRNRSKRMKQIDQQQQVEEQHQLQGEDRISELPDELLHHILTLLVIEEALRTRVLSKRWNSLWTSIPVLDFGQAPPSPPPTTSPRRNNSTKSTAFWYWSKSRFLMNLLDNLLLNHRDDSRISKFSLYFQQHLTPSRVRSWLSNILASKNIQHLTLSFHYTRSDFVFPYSLFTCNSLTVFKLETACGFKLPSTSASSSSSSTQIYFPSLKVLYLIRVTFFDDHEVEQLFSNCPVLEKLELDKCKWVNVNTIKISAPALKRLTIVDKREAYSRYYGVGNCKLQLSLPNIKALAFFSYLPKDLDCCSMPFLDRACLCIRMDARHVFHWKACGVLSMKFLGPISKVQGLVLQCGVGEVLFRSPLRHFPKFHNLTGLTLWWQSVCLASTTLVNILEAVPNLTCLYIYKTRYTNVGNDSSRITSPRPQCLLSRLKLIRISEVSESDGHLDMIEFFLKNARVLEDMFVRTSTRLAKEQRRMIAERVCKLRTCSKMTLHIYV